MKIKLCGLTRPEDIAVANELRPDYIGFVFWKKSMRYVNMEQARELKALLSPQIKAVGVFVDEDPDFIGELLAEKIIDIPQLHGHEDEAYIELVRSFGPGEIFKAFVVKDESALEGAFASSADRILLDSGKGTGHPFDWDLLSHIGSHKPYFLAGGLNMQNVEMSLKLSSSLAYPPYGLDVSSGIETDGLKDAQKMRDFVQAVRG